MALFGAATFQMTDGEPDQIEGAAVEGRYFTTLGLQPLLGRWLTADDASRETPVAVICQWDRQSGWRSKPTSFQAL